MILSERYLDIILGDLTNTLILILQSPLIAGLIILKWKEVDEPTDTLYFVMALSAIWFGCANACREIIKEKAIYQRERKVNLSIPAYILSKITVLSVLGFIQNFVFVLLLVYYLPIKGNSALIFLLLFLASTAGTAMGLMVSSLVNSEDKAVWAVPILLIPQILFSDITLPSRYQTAVTKFLSCLTISKYPFDGLQTLSSLSFSYLKVFLDLTILFLFIIFFLTLSGIFLKLQD